MGTASYTVFLGERANGVCSLMVRLREGGMGVEGPGAPGGASRQVTCPDLEGVAAQLASSLTEFYREVRAENGTLLVWLVTDAGTEESAERVLPAVSMIAEKAAELYGESVFRLATVLMVPPSATPSPWVYPVLEALSAEERLYHFGWVLSNGPQALTDAQVDGQVAQFLLLGETGAFNSYFLANSQIDSIATRLGTFGLSGLDAPAALCLRKKAENLAVQALNQMLSERLPSLPAETRDHSVPDLVDRICSGTEMSVLQKLQFSDDRRIPNEQYPDRLWSIYHFFTLGRTTSAWKLIQRNAERLWSVLKDSADQKFSAVLKKCVAPAQLREMLDGMAKGAENALADSAPAHRVIEEVGAGISRMMSACRRMPHVPAILVLWMSFVFLGGFFGFRPILPKIFPMLGDMPPSQSTAIMLAGWGIFSLLITFGVYALQLKRRGIARRDATSTVVEAVTGSFRLQAHNLALAILKQYHEYTGAEKLADSLPGRLERYIAALGAVRQAFSGGSAGKPISRACFMSCNVDAEWRDPGLSCESLLTQWVGQGLHERLMTLDEDALGDALTAEFSKHLKLAGTLLGYWAGQPENDRFERGNFLFTNAQPMAFLPGPGNQVTQEVFLFYRRENELDPAALFRLSGVTQRHVFDNSHLLVYMRVLLGLQPNQFDLGCSGGVEK